jgi:putative transposase
VSKKKRHSDAEIAAKLVRANAMAEDGRTQGEIAHALEVSVMTFHRWRKAHPMRTGAPLPNAERDRNELIADLQLENARLRRLVTDLLLDKIKLEENRSTRPNETASYGLAMRTGPE